MHLDFLRGLGSLREKSPKYLIAVFRSKRYLIRSKRYLAVRFERLRIDQ